MYADVITESRDRAIKETNRRREIQMKYNYEHGITPQTIQKKVFDAVSIKLAPFVQAAVNGIEGAGFLDIENVDVYKRQLYECLMGLAKSMEFKNGQILWPVRTALSGKPSSPGGATELAVILGKEETIRTVSYTHLDVYKRQCRRYQGYS